MNGAQATGCSPVATAYAAGPGLLPPGQARHASPSRWRSATPADGPYALDAARTSGGGIDAVDDDEIRAGIRLLAETTGIFTETAGGVTTATLAKLAARGDIDADERVVLVITGDGPQDARRGARHVRGPRDRRRRFDQFVEQVEGGVRGLMAVTVKMPTQLRAAAGGAGDGRGGGRDGRRGARALFAQHGELRDRLMQDGELRRFVNVYVDDEDVSDAATGSRRRSATAASSPSSPPSPGAEPNVANSSVCACSTVTTPMPIAG